MIKRMINRLQIGLNLDSILSKNVNENQTIKDRYKQILQKFLVDGVILAIIHRSLYIKYIL
jgi:hypothetical protein